MRLLARHHLPGQVLSGVELVLAMQANASSRVYGSGSPVRPELRLPGGSRFDLSLVRTVGPWSLTATVGNVFDRPYYGIASDPEVIVPVLTGRSLTLTAMFRD